MNGVAALRQAAPPEDAGSPQVPAPLVAVRGLRLAYRDREVLHGIDLTIAPGERVALVGPNGAGKSSLLRCLTGVARGRRGQVLLDGVPLETYPREAIARRVAVVPEPAALPFSMRVQQVVALGRLPHEHPLLGPRPADRLAIAAAVERVGIGHLADRDARELSLGERQLVLLAMAIAQEGRLLALDEPTVHLDLRHQVATMECLVELSRIEGTAILAVLHDLSLASHFFERTIVLHDGRIVADGPPESVLDAALIRGVFGVDPGLVSIGSPRGSSVRAPD